MKNNLRSLSKVAYSSFNRAKRYDVIITDITTLSGELNNAEEAIGLAIDGTYVQPTGTNYLDSSSSIMDALVILDGKIKELFDLVR